MSREETLTQFVAWAQHNITGDEKGQAQIFLDRLFQKANSSPLQACQTIIQNQTAW